VYQFFFESMEGYTVDEESRRELEGEWSQNSQWMQEMAAPIVNINHTLISQMLHGPNLLPSPFSAFRPPPMTSTFNYSQGGQLESPHSISGGRILQGEKEVAATTTKTICRKEEGTCIKRRSKEDEEE
jgi:hypothetical protein